MLQPDWQRDYEILKLESYNLIDQKAKISKTDMDRLLEKSYIIGQESQKDKIRGKLGL